MPLYATGHNRPGYLPNDDGTSRLITRDWQRARDSLIDDLRDAAEATQTWADPHDCDDIPCPTYGDDCPDNLAADLRMAADELGALQPDSPWQATVAGRAWWLHDSATAVPTAATPGDRGLARTPTCDQPMVAPAFWSLTTMDQPSRRRRAAPTAQAPQTSVRLLGEGRPPSRPCRTSRLRRSPAAPHS